MFWACPSWRRAGLSLQSLAPLRFARGFPFGPSRRFTSVDGFVFILNKMQCASRHVVTHKIKVIIKQKHHLGVRRL